MAVTIKLRRGLEASRLGVIFESGEIIYVTDTKKLYVGDGVTAGGNEIHLSHIDNDGSDHSFIDQDVQTSASPEFASLNLTDNTGLTYQVELIADSVSMTSDRTLTLDVKDGNRVLTLGANLETAGAGPITLTTTGTTSLTLPESGTLATEGYVDERIQGLDIKDACRAQVTATDLIVAGAVYDNGASGVGATLTGGDFTPWASADSDDVAIGIGDRVLIKNEDTNQQVNGIYEFTQNGNGVGLPFIFTRTADFDGNPAGEVTGGCYTFVQEGTLFSDMGFVVTTDTDPIVVGTTPITWTQFSGAGQIVPGYAMDKTGNQLDVIPNDLSAYKVVSDSTEFLAAIAAQEKKIYMKIGTYTITTEIALYDDLTIVGEGSYYNIGGVGGVEIVQSTSGLGIFKHIATESANKSLTSAPVRGDESFTLTAQIGTTHSAGEVMVRYTSGINSTFLIPTDVSATDVTLPLHSAFPFVDGTFTGTTVRIVTNLIKNITLHNLRLTNITPGDGDLLINIDGGTNINVSNINTPGASNHAKYVGVVGLKVKNVSGEYTNNAQILYGCSEMDLSGFHKEMSVANPDVYWVSDIQGCFNFSMRDSRDTNLWINNSAQFEVNNVHMTKGDIDYQDLRDNSYFTMSNCSIGTGGSGSQGSWWMNGCDHFRLEGIRVESGANDAFDITNSSNFEIVGCSAPNYAINPIVLTGSSNYRVFGNHWQENVVHELDDGLWTVVSTAQELIDATTRQDKKIFIKNGTYNLNNAEIYLYSGLEIVGEAYPSQDANVSSDGVFIKGNENVFLAASGGRNLSDPNNFYDEPTETLTMTATPSYMDHSVTTTAQPIANLEAGTIVVISNDVAAEREVNVLDRRMSIADTTMYLRNPILRSMSTGTEILIYRSPVRNVKIKNIMFQGSDSTGANLDRIGLCFNGASGIELSNIGSAKNSANPGPLFKGTYDITIDGLDGHYNNWYGMQFEQGRHISIKDINATPEVADTQTFDMVNVCEVDIMGGTTGQININYGDYIDIVGISNFANVHQTSDKAVSIINSNNITIHGGTIVGHTTTGLISANGCDNIVISGVNFPDSTSRAVGLYNANDYVTVSNCIASSVTTGDVVDVITGATTTLREFGNSWQGNPVPAGVATASGTVFTGEYAINAIHLWDNDAVSLDTITVNGTAFVEGTDFNKGVDAYATLTSLEAAINGAALGITATIPVYGSDNYLKLASDTIGTAGNSLTLLTTGPFDHNNSTFYGGRDAISQGSDSTESTTFVLGRDSGIDSTSTDSAIINSYDSYISDGANGTTIVGGHSNLIEENTSIGESWMIGSSDCKIYDTGDGYNSMIGSRSCEMVGIYGYNMFINCDTSIVSYATSSDVLINTYNCIDGSSYGWNTFINCENINVTNDTYGNLFHSNGHNIENTNYSFVTGQKVVSGAQDGHTNSIVQGGGSVYRAQGVQTVHNDWTTTSTPSTGKYAGTDIMMNNGENAASTAVGFIVTLVATQYATTGQGTVGDSCIKIYKGGLKIDNTGTASLIGDISEELVAYDAAAETWDLTFSIVNNKLRVQSQGETGKSISFGYEIKFIEVGR